MVMIARHRAWIFDRLRISVRSEGVARIVEYQYRQKRRAEVRMYGEGL